MEPISTSASRQYCRLSVSLKHLHIPHRIVQIYSPKLTSNHNIPNDTLQHHPKCRPVQASASSSRPRRFPGCSGTCCSSPTPSAARPRSFTSSTYVPFPALVACHQSLLLTRPQELHPSFSVFPTYPIILPFKGATQEVVDFIASQKATPIPGVPEFDPNRAVDGTFCAL